MKTLTLTEENLKMMERILEESITLSGQNSPQTAITALRRIIEYLQYKLQEG